MNKSRLRISLTAAAVFLTALACALPGLTTASAPTPTADTVLLSTMVAETVSAALDETASAVTPVPTDTPVPPPPTTTATATQPSSGSTLAPQYDGSSYFIDQRAGYELTVAAGWLAVRADGPEYQDAWNLAQTATPAIQQALKDIGTQDPNQFRLFALDTQDGHLRGGFVTNIEFFWSEQDEMSLENETNLLAASASLPQAHPGLEVLTTELSRTASGIPIGVITSRWPTQTTDGADIVVFQKQVFLDLKTGTLTITLSAAEDLRDTVLPGFDKMIETVLVTQ